MMETTGKMGKMGNNRYSLRTTLFMALLTLALALPAYAAVDSEQKEENAAAGISTAEIFTAAVEAFPACLNYCITGISIRLYYDGTTWYIYYSPLIRHNSADFVVHAYPTHGQEPWIEWAAVMGNAQKAVLTPAIPALLGLEGLTEYFSGQTRYKQYGRHQTHNLKEADVIGNPFIVLILILDEENSGGYGSAAGGEEAQCQTEGCLEKRDDETGEMVNTELETEREREEAEEEGRPWHEMTTDELYAAASEEVKESIGDYQEKVEKCANDLRCVVGIIGSKRVSETFSILDTIDTAMKYIRIIKKIIEIVKIAVKLYFSSYGGIESEVRIERYLCENDHNPFVPYYLSGIDFMFWRDGLPITDPHMTMTILNPFSGDRVISSEGLQSELLGHIYPRQGFVDHPVDAKVGAVTAARALNIVSESKRRRLRWNKKGFGIDGRDGWQMIYPQRELVCHPNIGDTPIRDMESPLTASYAWNYWRPYACDTNSRGAQIAKIEFSEPVCPDIDVTIDVEESGGNDDENNENREVGDGGGQ